MQEVLALNKIWADSVTKGDSAALDRLFADDIVVISGSGKVRDKSGEIKDAAGPPDPEFAWVQPLTTEDMRVRIYNDAAVVTGIAKWGFKYKGQAVNNERRYTHVYVKQKGRWRMVTQQMSPNLVSK
ncbi:MAG: nuclear transport factor 2 family protein [Pyrinomonadaceae bacterium]